MGGERKSHCLSGERCWTTPLSTSYHCSPGTRLDALAGENHFCFCSRKWKCSSKQTHCAKLLPPSPPYIILCFYFRDCLSSLYWIILINEGGFASAHQGWASEHTRVLRRCASTLCELAACGSPLMPFGSASRYTLTALIDHLGVRCGVEVVWYENYPSAQ